MTEQDRQGREFYPRRERRGELPPFHQTAKFDGEESAGSAYHQAQEAIYIGLPNDLSAFRLQLRLASDPTGSLIWHVAILGKEPAADLKQKLEEILSAGQSVDLPEDVLKTLTERRRQANRLGGWVEGHYHPGNRI